MCGEFENVIRNEDESLFKHLLAMIAFIATTNPDESLRILAMIMKDDICIDSIYQYTMKSLKESGVSRYS